MAGMMADFDDLSPLHLQIYHNESWGPQCLWETASPASLCLGTVASELVREVLQRAWRMLQGAVHIGHGDRAALLGLKVEDIVATMLEGWIGLGGAVWGRNSSSLPNPLSPQRDHLEKRRS